jgi:hypothetical protein
MTSMQDAHFVPDVPRNAGNGAVSGGLATLGTVLIVLGAAFLGAQFVPYVEWWQLWPLAIVVVGLIELVTPGARGWGLDRLAEAVGTILFGAILLANTTGVVAWEMWLTFFALWPVLLVAAGLGILGHATGQGWIRALAPLAIWAALIYAAATTWAGLEPVVSGITIIVK